MIILTYIFSRSIFHIFAVHVHMRLYKKEQKMRGAVDIFMILRIKLSFFDSCGMCASHMMMIYTLFI